MKKLLSFFVIILLVLTFLPVQADAVFGGSLNSFFLFRCTCGPGYLTYMKGVGGAPSGLYYFGPQTRYWTGSGYPVAWNLLDYTPNGAQCYMNAGEGCYYITANLVNRYGGAN